MFVLRFQNLPYMISRENQDFLQIFQQIMHVILGSHRKKKLINSFNYCKAIYCTACAHALESYNHSIILSIANSKNS